MRSFVLQHAFCSVDEFGHSDTM